MHSSARANAAPSRSAPPAAELRLLVVDDDLLQARVLRANLARPGSVEVTVAGSGEEALALLAERPYDVVLSDVRMPEMDGIELVRRVRQIDPSLAVILVTAEATIQGAVEGIRAGATDFVSKPLNVDAVLALARRAAAERGLRADAETLRTRRAAPADEVLCGIHPRMDAVRAFAASVAAVGEARVLVTGPTGTGKSRLARLIHDLAGAPGRFVAVNCAALPAQLLESELFGHEKGAFTDARTLRRGLIEVAERGTLLLDEVGALTLELQAKLLLFLESRSIRRVGGSAEIPVRTRVIAATNEDLRARVRDRTFRSDLLYRLDVASIRMPALAEMPDVIPELVARFAAELAAELVRPAPEVDPVALAQLRRYPWPGNARELRNAVERAMIFHRAGALRVLPPAEPVEAAERDGVYMEPGLTLDQVERRYMRAALAAGGELGRVAETLGISRKSLWEKRRRLAP